MLIKSSSLETIFYLEINTFRKDFINFKDKIPDKQIKGKKAKKNIITIKPSKSVVMP